MRNCFQYIFHSTNAIALLCTVLVNMIYECQGRNINDTIKRDRPGLGVTRVADMLLGATTTLSGASSDTLKNKTSADSIVKAGANASYTSLMTATQAPKKHNLPLPLIIASPVVTVCIVIFICITYKMHVSQLNEQAKQLANKMTERVCSPTTSCMPCSPCRTKRPLIPPGRAQPELDEDGNRRISLLSFGSQVPDFANKRGSSFSALSDQEILNHASPRRHSTFVL